MAERARVLVIEDDPGTRELYSVVLSEEGFECVCVPDVDRGARSLDSAVAVVSDLAAAKDLSAGTRSSRPLLIVSASPDAPGFASAVGAQFLAKPFDIDELTAAMKRLLGRRG